MKKPSLKDKLLSAATVEEAHRKLTQANAPAGTPQIAAIPPLETPGPQPHQEPKIPEKALKTVPAQAERAAIPARRGNREASAYPERNIRITVDVPESLHERMKLHTVLQKQSIRDFILTLVEREIARK